MFILLSVRTDMEIKCPGATEVKLEVIHCSKCNGEVEIFTDEYKTNCPNCNEVVFRDNSSCIDWCPYAKRCLEERDKFGLPQTGLGHP